MVDGVCVSGLRDLLQNRGEGGEGSGVGWRGRRGEGRGGEARKGEGRGEKAREGEGREGEGGEQREKGIGGT